MLLSQDHSDLVRLPVIGERDLARSSRDVIAVESVTYRYPGAEAPALVDVTAGIRRGESLGIVGPTGAGKSTLVDVVLGLLPPTSGRFQVW